MTEQTVPRRHILRVLLLSLAAALLTALLQLLIVAVRRDLFHELLWTWWARDQVRVTPLGYLVAFAPITLLLIATHALFPRRVSLPVVAGALSTLGVFALLLLFPRIAPLAWLAVALGAGVQVARAWRARPDGAWRWTVRAAAVLTAGFVLVGVVTMVMESRAERRQLLALPPASDGAPNVLILILDTVRAQSMSLYGESRETTPAIARRARDGVTFDAAYSTAPWTLPSHASMFTGVYASQQSGDWETPMDGTHATLAEVFRDRGYTTSAFVANFLAAGYRSGLSRGFVRYEDFRNTFTETALNSTLAQTNAVAGAWQVWRENRWLGGAVRKLATFDFHQFSTLNTHDSKPASIVVDDVLRWRGSAGHRPFFTFVNFFDAHAPYRTPLAYRTRFDSTGRAYGRYLGGIRYIDDEIDRLLRGLDERHELDNTIVVIASDHGELFGEHGLTGHGNALYTPLLHVPLVILAPGRVPRGVRVARLVSLRDLAATVVDLAGVPNDRSIPGTSLRSLMNNPAGPATSDVLSEVSAGVNDVPKNPTYQADLKSARNDSINVIVSSRRPVEVYAYRSDTAELRNLADTQARRDSAIAWTESLLRGHQLTWRPSARKAAAGGAPSLR